MLTLYFETISFNDFFSLTSIYKTISEKMLILELFKLRFQLIISKSLAECVLDFKSL